MFTDLKIMEEYMDWNVEIHVGPVLSLAAPDLQAAAAPEAS